MKPLYSFKAWFNFLIKDTKHYLEYLKSETKMRTPKELRKCSAEEFKLDKNQPDNFETATFALGCFWSPDALFGGLQGVIRTRVGYAGGNKLNPTYRDLGSHSETVQIDYKPDKISYNELLEIFWKNHNPRSKQKTQYASKIFYQSKEEKEKAQSSLEEEDENNQINTEIQELDKFWIAEDYHQKYYLRQSKDLMKKLREKYSPEEFINSTVAARLNASVSGKGEINLSDLRLPEDFMKLIKSKKSDNTGNSQIC